MNILYICPYYKPAYIYGGPVQCFSDTCEGLAELGAQVTVFTTNANGSSSLDVPLKMPANVDGVTVWYFPLALGGLSFFYSATLAKAVRSRISEFDLVVIAAPWGYPLIPAARACIRAQVPYVISTHGQLFPWALAKKRLKKRIYLELIARRFVDQAAAIHCTDPSEAEAVARLMFRSPIFVVPNPIRASSFSARRTKGDLRKRFNISNNAEIIMFLGRITRIKRPDIAVDVLGAAQSLGRDIHLVIVGPDEEGLMYQLQGQAQSLGCHDKLHFTGLLTKDEVISALSDAELLLMPSEVTENFGIAALEAMATGIPILVSEGVPVGRWAQAAGAGLVVASTREEFQQAAIELLSRPAQLREMGQRGQKLAREVFDVPIVASQLLDKYVSIIKDGGSTGASRQRGK